jgi:hypothetical protein
MVVKIPEYWKSLGFYFTRCKYTDSEVFSFNIDLTVHLNILVCLMLRVLLFVYCVKLDLRKAAPT